MTKLRCWPGCLAVIEKARLPENVGKVVEVLRPDDRLGWWELKAGPSLVRGVYRALPGKVGDGHGGPWYAPDAWLRPITPPPGSITDSEVEELYRAPSLPVKEQA